MLNSIQAYWAKKQVTKRDYGNHFSQLPSYCFLEENTEGVWVGFLTVHNSEMGMPCNSEDLRRVDLARRSNNLLPTPFKEEKKEIVNTISVTARKNLFDSIKAKGFFKQYQSYDDYCIKNYGKVEKEKTIEEKIVEEKSTSELEFLKNY